MWSTPLVHNGSKYNFLGEQVYADKQHIEVFF